MTASEVLDLPSKPPRKVNHNLPANAGLGGNTYADKTLAPLFNQTIVKKQESARNTWANTAIVLVERAKRASQSYSKKDFNALYRLVLSAGIAFDKAFPQVQAPQGGNLVIQLFGSLGSDTTRAILEPPRPILDVTPSDNLTTGADLAAIPMAVRGINTTNPIAVGLPNDDTLASDT